MRRRAAGVAVACLLAGLVTGCAAQEPSSRGGAAPSEAGEASPRPEIEPRTARTFEIREGDPRGGGRGCEVAREPAAQKLTPSLDDLRAKLGDEATEFVVSMKAEVSPSDYPLPSGGRDAPDTWKRDERYLARASKLAEEQACAVAELRARGGTYLESFLLVNAFRAQMKPEQAAELSQRADVKLVELSQTDAPPPF